MTVGVALQQQVIEHSSGAAAPAAAEPVLEHVAALTAPMAAACSFEADAWDQVHSIAEAQIFSIRASFRSLAPIGRWTVLVGAR